MKQITSIKDEKITTARAIKTLKGRSVHHLILLEGEQIIDWAIENKVHVEYILVADSALATSIEKYTSQHVDLYRVSDGIQKKVTNTNYVVPLVGIGQIHVQPNSLDPNFLLVLDNVKDFGNLGTIVRTCHAFGIRKIISTTNEFDLYQRKTIEASRGRVFSTSVEKHQSSEETIKSLHQRGYQVVATSPRGSHLQSLVKLAQKPVALVVGNESDGVSQTFEDQADFLIQIPMSQDIESLNVGVATGISVYELKLKQVLSMIEQQIKSTLGRELNVTGMLVQKALDAELKKVSDLSSQQVIFMMVLRCDQEMSIAGMCRQFGLLDADVDAFLSSLLENRVVIKDANLKLTDKGEELLAKLWFTIENTEQKILSGFTDEEASCLKKQLHHIQENCIQIMRQN